MKTAKTLLAVWLAAGVLSGCASAANPEPKTWTGGDPSHLAADQAACHKDTDSIDARTASGYSDSRYGVASALAEAIDRDDPLRDHSGDARIAAFITCMSNKGWHPG
jgi:hypothetical protein